MSLQLNQRVQHLFEESIQAKVEALPLLEQPIVEAAELIVSQLLNGAKLLSCGNGGSAADAQHLVAQPTRTVVIGQRDQEGRRGPERERRQAGIGPIGVDHADALDRHTVDRVDLGGQEGDELDVGKGDGELVDHALRALLEDLDAEHVAADGPDPARHLAEGAGELCPEGFQKLDGGLGLDALPEESEAPESDSN